MLKIIMGTENIKKYRPDLEFIGAPHEMFEFKKKTSWFEHDFVKRVITAIDNAKVELGFSVRSLENGDGYSVNDLSGGCKCLILMYERRNEPVIIRATGGDNCFDFIEEIAAACEKDGRDLAIASNYFYWWNFKFIKNVYFYNWDMTCSSQADLQKAFDKWYDYERPVRRELTEEEQEEEDAMLEESIRELMERMNNKDNWGYNMLKIILGIENADKYIDTKEHRFVRYVNDWFDHVRKEEWFDDPFVQKIIREIDNAEVVCGSAVRSLTTRCGYSADHLSGGAKYIIMLYEYMDKPHRFLVTMGDNYTCLLEQIVKMYEAKGLDTIIVADYFYRWNYDVIGSVYFYNWDVTVHNEKEAYELAFRPWFDYNEPVREEQTEEEEDAELEMIGKDIERRLKLREANSQSLKEQSLDKLVY